MNAMESVASAIAGERDVLPPWEEFRDEVIARLALPPVWTFTLAEQVGFEATPTLDGLGFILDALAQAGLLENSSTLDAADWELRVQPKPESRRILEAGGRTLAQARSAAAPNART